MVKKINEIQLNPNAPLIIFDMGLKNNVETKIRQSRKSYTKHTVSRISFKTLISAFPD